MVKGIPEPPPPRPSLVDPELDADGNDIGPETKRPAALRYWIFGCVILVVVIAMLLRKAFGV